MTILSLVSIEPACSSMVTGTALDPTTTGAHGAVSTDQRLASDTGLRILRSGGDAVDAAVAIGYALAVTYPAAGNLGGGGSMLVRLAAGDAHFIDFRETAPAAATAGMYLDPAGHVIPNLSTVGPLSAGVPGGVAGLEYARAKYGTLPRHELRRDAIDAAELGFVLSEADAAAIARAKRSRRFSHHRRYLRDGRRDPEGRHHVPPTGPCDLSIATVPTAFIADPSRRKWRMLPVHRASRASRI